MSHVDEGRLHAFLDGALSAADPADAERVELHLAACADCRARLDEATRLRDEASDLLAAAQPRAFVMPSFDAIRARSETVAPAQRVKPTIFRTPFNDFAWAAMVVLALGLGWMLNDTMDGDQRVVMSRPEEMAASDESGGFTTYEIPQIGSASDEPQTLAAPEENQQAGADAAANTPPPSVAAAPTGAGGERAAEAEYDVIGEVAAPTQLADDARDMAAREETRALAQAPAPAPARMESQRRASEAPAAAAPAPPAVQVSPDAMAGASLGAGAGDDDEDWRGITVTEAERLTGGDLVRLAGARITSSATRGSGSELEVRTVQLTDRGESIKVVQRRTTVAEARPRVSADAQAEMPAEPVVTAGLTVRVEEWTVTLSGAVPPERLRELAANLS